MANVSFCAAQSFRVQVYALNIIIFKIHSMTVLLFLLGGQNAACSSPRKWRTPASLSSLTRTFLWSGWNMSTRRSWLIWCSATSLVSSTFQERSFPSSPEILTLKSRPPVASCAPSTSWSGKVGNRTFILPTLVSDKRPLCNWYLVLFMSFYSETKECLSVNICLLFYFIFHSRSINSRHVQTSSHILYHWFYKEPKIYRCFISSNNLSTKLWSNNNLGTLKIVVMILLNNTMCQNIVLCCSLSCRERGGFWGTTDWRRNCADLSTHWISPQTWVRPTCEMGVFRWNKKMHLFTDGRISAYHVHG